MLSSTIGNPVLLKARSVSSCLFADSLDVQAVKKRTELNITVEKVNSPFFI
jgi:hypothetical protein